MDIDSSSSQDAARNISRTVFVTAAQYHPVHSLSLAPLPSFEAIETGPQARAGSPVPFEDVDEDPMNFSQLTASQASSSLDMDSDGEEGTVAATREPTPMPEEPQTQGLHKMQSIVDLGPVIAAAEAPPPAKQSSASDARMQILEGFLERHLVQAHQLQTQQLSVLSAANESSISAWRAITQELSALKQELQQRVHVPRYSLK
ncbi:hypothetical protein BN946_scf184943.g85 [Trametes cinnabarina]|uniref:Uncharacterized protein n=1 Tax=Pycnoporus cinnabarinus TaxID=5643 RepID=A0A060SCG0_PYCCI|nr:hypothetical protein BN946_scf184943.g85 [Trametes cinnabarina]